MPDINLVDKITKKGTVFLKNGKKYASIHAFHNGEPPITENSMERDMGNNRQANSVPERSKEVIQEAPVQIKKNKDNYEWDDNMGWIEKKISKDDFIWDDVQGYIRK